MDHSTDSDCNAAPFHDRGTDPGSGSGFSGLDAAPILSTVLLFHPRLYKFQLAILLSR